MAAPGLRVGWTGLPNRLLSPRVGSLYRGPEKWSLCVRLFVALFRATVLPDRAPFHSGVLPGDGVVLSQEASK
jgi:hypothetical protein